MDARIVANNLQFTSFALDSAGTVAQKLDYLPFGSERVNVKYGAFETRFTYTDQERDDESGLLYYGARYYHPTLGRFTQPDPVITDIGRKELAMAMMSPQLLNGYSYVGNNPMKHVDPTGESGNPFGVPFDYATEGARIMGQFFQNTAENWRAQVNPLSTNNGAIAWGATSYTVAEGLDMVGGMFGNAEKVLDPETLSSQKTMAGVMLSLDLAGGGKGKAASRVGKQATKETAEKIGRVTQYVKNLDVSSRAVKKVDDIAGFTREGINQVISRGIKPGVIKDTIVNTRRYVQRVDKLGRESFRYVGDKAVLNFNRAKELITGWVKK